MAANAPRTLTCTTLCITLDCYPTNDDLNDATEGAGPSFVDSRISTTIVVAGDQPFGGADQVVGGGAGRFGVAVCRCSDGIRIHRTG